MNSSFRRAGRRCQNVLNSLHSMIYFSPDLGKDLSKIGIDDPMAVYLVGRAAALGPVGPGVIAAVFHGFKYELIAEHLPQVWRAVSPATVLAARLRAADATWRRFLGAEAIAAPEMAEAASLALRATEACSRPGRPLYAAHADLPVPDAPHLALWHAATVLREHRGDSHFSVLACAELDGLEALVSHSASSEGMPKAMVMTKRGWTQEDWDAAQQRLSERGLMDGDGELTDDGVRLREDLEDDTDRLDQGPYHHLGPAGVARLTELATCFTATAATAGAFPAALLDVFVKERLYRGSVGNPSHPADAGRIRSA